MAESGKQDGLSLSVVHRDSEVVVQAVGEIDLLTVERFDTVVREELDAKPEVLVVDLSGLSFLSSQGLAVLVATQEAASPMGVQLRVATGNARAVVRPLEATGLADVLTLESPGAGTPANE